MLLSAKYICPVRGVTDLDPKPWVEEWIKHLGGTKMKPGRENLIDLSLEEYLGNPSTHVSRLWNHFKAMAR
jgi:hypothetical protein